MAEDELNKEMGELLRFASSFRRNSAPDAGWKQEKQTKREEKRTTPFLRTEKTSPKEEIAMELSSLLSFAACLPTSPPPDSPDALSITPQEDSRFLPKGKPPKKKKFHDENVELKSFDQKSTDERKFPPRPSSSTPMRNSNEISLPKKKTRSHSHSVQGEKPTDCVSKELLEQAEILSEFFSTIETSPKPSKP
eukprot:CAMPEP_0201484038 /NCGR_PEP_ID=MMETSP0151_2-20130828/8228_1 /ASSEMBLY_ACC=CAM_ASM_000257 /TAXON_ID=200890 /ORGANISM="Paramoeba atlantica, Strain 621/1 / CCAP 1560/9" /LENGTH=192 /DNA_ID=CAMNT_0047867487 /DNA_START=179 /DNA_END=757 /DNA_ORIENTATION=+